MKQYMYKIMPVRPDMLVESTSEEDEIISQHFNYLKGLTEQGTVFLAGRTLTEDYNSFGIVIFRAESDEIAKKIMLDDPAIKNRVMRGELYPYRVALMQPENLKV